MTPTIVLAAPTRRPGSCHDRPASPVILSVPHRGTQPLPGVLPHEYASRDYAASFPRGFCDVLADAVYDGLQRSGCTLVTSAYSRLFVDLNRRRDDFDLHDGEVRSERGVVKTHVRGGRPIFAMPLTPGEAERRLRAVYDPYYQALSRLVTQAIRQHGQAILLDGHTANPQKLGDHQIVIGTRRRKTASPALVERLRGVFETHGFEVSLDVPGYIGGQIVRNFGAPVRGVHAVQIEVNAELALATSYDEFRRRRRAGVGPLVDWPTVRRLRRCMVEAIAAMDDAVRKPAD